MCAVLGQQSRRNTLQHAATYCNTLQHTAAYCNILQHPAYRWAGFPPQHAARQWKTLQSRFMIVYCIKGDTATHCNTLQHTATHCNTPQRTAPHCNAPHHTATHCNTLQHTATHRNAPQRTAARGNTLQLTLAHCNTLQHTATHCNTLQRTVTRYNTLYHAATQCNAMPVISRFMRHCGVRACECALRVTSNIILGHVTLNISHVTIPMRLVSPATGFEPSNVPYESCHICQSVMSHRM